MIVETLNDWNNLLSCCCEMPSCPVPEMICKSLEGDEVSHVGNATFVPPAGIALDDDLPFLYDFTIDNYRTENGHEWGYESGPGTYPMSGEFQFTRTYDVDTRRPDVDQSTFTSSGNTHDEVLNTCEADEGTGFYIEWYYGSPVDSIICQETEYYDVETSTAIGGTPGPFELLGCDGPFEADYKEGWNVTQVEHYGGKLINPKDKASLIAEAIGEVPAGWVDATNGCTSYLQCDWPTKQSVLDDWHTWPGCDDGSFVPLKEYTMTATAKAQKAQVQWRVPDSHEGSYFKVWFDVIEEPDGWEEEGGPARSWYAQNVVREWEGPGTGSQSDPSWIIGIPYDIPPPTTPGVRRVVNIRYECYRGPYGNKVETTGEGVELP
jgi:hypothetical protein